MKPNGIKENFHFIQANATSIPLADNFFDYIICTHSFHHYLHPHQALKVIDKILKATDKAHVKMYSTKEFKKMYSLAGFKYLSNKSMMDR